MNDNERRRAYIAMNKARKAEKEKPVVFTAKAGRKTVEGTFTQVGDSLQAMGYEMHKARNWEGGLVVPHESKKSPVVIRRRGNGD